jgi:gluconolactonase
VSGLESGRFSVASNAGFRRLEEIVGAEDKLVEVAGGFLFVEGPVWHPIDKHLTFSDIPADTTYRWDAEAGLATLRQSSNKTNGNAYDRAGRLISCEHSTSRVVRTELDGTVTILADRYDGMELNSPNDVIVAADGTIFFTDPPYGRTVEAVGVLRDLELSVNGVYRLSVTGDLALIIEDCEGPNGLCLSPDEQYLFVNDSERGHIRRFELRGDELSGGEVWAEPTGVNPGVVDGMKTDRSGNLYCTGPGGVFVYSPSGDHIGVIEAPEVVANFAWGGSDLKTLYLCATTTVYARRTKVPGLAAF